MTDRRAAHAGVPDAMPVPAPDAGRDVLLAAVKERVLAGFEPSGAAFVVGDDAADLAARLWRSVPSPRTDASLLFANGWLHWLRYLSMPDPAAHAELEQALDLLTVLQEQRRDAVPPQVAGYLEARAAGQRPPDPGRAERGQRLLLQAMASGGAALLDAAVAVLTPAADDEPQAAALLGTALIARYERDRIDADLDDAIAALHAAEQGMPAGHPGLGDLRSNLGAALRDRFDLTRDADDLDAAVMALNAALDVTAADDPGRVATLSTLATARLDRFRVTHDPQDLEAALVAARAATALPAGAQDWRALTNLSACLCQRFRVTGEPGDLDDGIEVADRALSLVPAGHPQRTLLLQNLARALRDRYDLAHRTADLNRAVALLAGLAVAWFDRATDSGDSDDFARARESWERALETFAAAHATGTSEPAAPIRTLLDVDQDPQVDQDPTAAYLAGLGNVLNCLAGTDPAEQGRCLVQALLLLRTVAGRGWPLPRTIAGVYRHNPRWLSDDWRPALAGDAEGLVRSDTQDDPLSLSIAIELFRATLRLPPSLGYARPELVDHDRRRFECLSRLGVFLRVRSEVTHSAADLDQALQSARQCLNHPRASEAERASLELNASLAHRDRYQLHRSVQDREQWLAHARAAVQHLGERDPRRAVLVTNLIAAWRSDPAEADADACLDEILEATAGATDEGAPEPSLGVNRTAALITRYQRRWDTRDLDEAIGLLHRLVVRSDLDAESLAGCLSNLAVALMMRHDALEATVDIEDGLAAARRAVTVAARDDPDLAMYYSNLSLLTLTYAHRFGGQQRSDLDTAVEAARHAVAATAEDSPRYPAHLNNLATALMARSDLVAAGSGGPTSDEASACTDLDEAAALSARAATMCQGRPDLGRHLGNVVVAALHRYRVTSSPVELEALIARCAEALAALSPTDAARAGVLLALSEALAARGSDGDPERAARYAQGAAGIVGAPLTTRLRAANAWADQATERADWPAVCRACDTVAELVELATSSVVERLDTERAAARAAGLPSRAAAAHLMVGDPDAAVVAFERSHAALLTRQLETRQGLRALERLHPDLAHAYREVTGRLAALDRYELWSGSSAAPRVDVAAERTRLMSALADVRTRIRALDGFSSFGARAPVTDLRRAAQACPVVLFSIADARSDALVLTASGVDVVPLPQVTPELVKDKALLLWGALDDVQQDFTGVGTPAFAEYTILQLLAWLWDAVTEPVLTALGFDAPAATGQARPGICWCPSGFLSLLPLHAAGHYPTPPDDPTPPDAVPRTVMDRVVSTYTPTLGALLAGADGTSGDQVPGQDVPDVVVVAMPTTPGAAALPGAASEARAIRALVGDRVRLFGAVEGGSPATAQAVLAALSTGRWAHFACHAEGDLRRPSGSRLLLADSDSRPVTVRDLMALDLGDPDLAYLSACATARPALGLLDEVVHLASAFTVMGYRHVVATLWPVGDRSAQFVSERFYRGLLAGAGDGPASSASAAVALHDAVRALRDLVPGRPSKWAAHLHVGPCSAPSGPSAAPSS